MGWERSQRGPTRYGEVAKTSGRDVPARRQRAASAHRRHDLADPHDDGRRALGLDHVARAGDDHVPDLPAAQVEGGDLLVVLV